MDAAHAAYSTALHLCRTSAESWVSWSQLCDEQWEASLAAGNPQPQLLEYSVHSVVQVRAVSFFSNGGGRGEKRWAAAAASQGQRRVVHVAARAAGRVLCVLCCAQGVRLGAASARALLPRLLCQLSFDNDYVPQAKQVRVWGLWRR